MAHPMLRCTVLLLLLASLASGQSSPKQPAALSAQQAAADFDQFWREIGLHYAYMAEKRIRWSRVRDLYRAQASQARNRVALLHVLEQAIAELYDDHATLGADAPGSPRIVPSRTDFWGSWHGEVVVIDEVRPGSVAAAAGLRAGDEVLAVGGRPISEAVARELPRTLVAPDPHAQNWAVRRVLAGRRGQSLDISVRHFDGRTATVTVADHPTASPNIPLEARRLTGAIGYIRIHNSLADPALIPAFAAALADLRDIPSLVLDLRDTPGGGDSAVAEPILGRFTDRLQGYQKFVVPVQGWQHTRSFVEKVRPRDPFIFRGKLVLLVDHWTASMGEGIAVGLAGMHRATIVGTAMAGLNGATHTQRLRFSGIPFSYPAERIYTVDGTPRELFQPDIIVPLAGAKTPDPILECALAVLSDGTSEVCKPR